MYEERLPGENQCRLLACLAQQLATLPQKRVVLAVSGGADSLAMMHVCANGRMQLGAEYIVATLDHGLRDEASKQDCERVQELACEWGLPCVTGAVDARKYAKSERLNLEEAARILRYDFLTKCAKEWKAAAIFTAHHADDQVETVLSHVLRGSGIRGLIGISERRELDADPKVLLIRPFLQLRRAELAEYCSRNELQPQFDHTNADLRLQRNRLRKYTIPQLHQYNPQMAASLSRLANVAAETDDFLESLASAFLAKECAKQDAAIVIPRSPFLAQHPAMQSAIMRRAVNDLGCRQIPSHSAIMQARRLADVGAGEKFQDMTPGIRMRLSYDILVIEKEAAPLPTSYPLLPLDYSGDLELPGTLALPGTSWSLQISAAAAAERGDLHIPEHSSVSLRTRRAGDRIRPLGLAGHSKSLKRWLIDRKVPQHLRSHLPILAIGSQLAALYWLECWHISEDFLPYPASAAGNYQLRWLR